MPSAAGLDRQRLLPPTLEARLIGTLGRTAGLAILLVLAAVWASLLSWSIADPSLTHATGGPIRNSLGALGAITADLFIQSLGLAAAIALLPLMMWGLEMTLSEHVSALRSKAMHYPLAVLALAGAASAMPTGASWPIAHGLGGILGDVIFDLTSGGVRLLSTDLATPVAALVLGGLGLAALTQAAGLSRDSMPKLRRTVRLPRADALDRMPHLSWSGAADLTARLARPGSLSSALSALSPWGRASAIPAMAAAYGSAHEPMLPGPFAEPHHAEPHRHTQQTANAPHFADDTGDDFDHSHDEDDDVVTEDPTLARSSRAIAERFAPAGARAIPREREIPAHDPAPHTPSLPEHDLPRFMRSAAAASNGAPAPLQPPHMTPTAQVAPQPAPAHRTPEPAPRAQSSLLRAVAGRAAAGFKRPLPAMLKKNPPSKAGTEFSQTVLRGTARLLEDVLADFGVKGEVRDIRPGPVVTLYELEPARGTKATRIMALADDIARSMSATSARVALIPGRNVIGIELPNSRRDTVGLRELIESPTFTTAEGALPLALGRSIGGEPVVADLARMPHLLVAGTTGSGKSVGVNAMILSILFRHTPEECRFLMIDPKMLELSVYNGIPHLLSPVVTDPQKAVGALNWVVAEMEERYKRMAQLSVRNIEAFNARVKSARSSGQKLARTVQTGFDAATGQPVFEREEMDLAPLPYIVVVVDEFADLMITAGKDIETAVQRLAQKARAAGIHLIMATQRPSVDIITGTIKANFPTRISFKVASKIDSRTILAEQGAEQLLGQGDMLMTSGAGQMLRVHGPFVSDEEVEAVAAHLRTQGAPRYVEAIAEARADAGDAAGPSTGEDGSDSLYDRAVAVVLRDRKATTSYIQRRLSIGYNRAADLIERMERDGLISAPNHAGRREILADETPARAVG